VNILVPIALFGWIPIVIIMFTIWPPRRALAIQFVFAWLFLPVAAYKFQGFPDYTKLTAASISALICIFIFDAQRLSTLRLKWQDLPILIWCVCPFVTALTNGLGAYDGASAVLNHFVRWGIPYYIGRLYFGDIQGINSLTTCVVVGALIYVPLCLWEIRVSPQLNLQLYGFRQHDFSQHVRMDGYRPMVFLSNGLEVAIWMSLATFIAFSLWYLRGLRHIMKIPIGVLTGILFMTLLLCKSLAPLIMLLGSVGIFFTCKYFKLTLPLVVVICIPPIYVVLRTTQLWSGQQAISLANYVSEDRAQSLDFRFVNENQLITKALQRQWFGWGGWGRSRIYNDSGKDISITDGLWVIALGQKGLIGVTALMLMFIVPLIIGLRYCSPGNTLYPTDAAIIAVIFIVLIIFINNLPNASDNPIGTLALGGLTGFASLSRSVHVPTKNRKSRALHF